MGFLVEIKGLVSLVNIYRRAPDLEIIANNSSSSSPIFNKASDYIWFWTGITTTLYSAFNRTMLQTL